ncbi:MAG TPA: ferritin-like domain-containing protein [Micromonosporaceae bacterium]
MSPIDALATALAAEHAAIFGYGVAGAHLDKSGQNTARQAEAAHRVRRDALLLRIAGAGATPPPAAPAYALPFAVTDRESALSLAVALEERTGQAWRAAIAATTGDERKLALDALIDCAVRATKWRVTARVDPATVTLPGVPD